MARSNGEFPTIRSEGGLLPPDLLRLVLDSRGGGELKGTRPEDYGLPAGERLNELITSGWNRLRKHWTAFREASGELADDKAGTSLTNKSWTLPLFRELGFGPLPTSAGPEIHGRTYSINRFSGPVPIHLVGCGVSLDRRAAGVRGAAANPHGLVQEYLNRSEQHLWGVVSNGLRLRVLRDSQALSRQSFLEFNVEGMFAGEVYSDFVLLWMLVHASRFAPDSGGRPDSCWLERWTQEAEQQGTRALGELRGGVERALTVLGQGFTDHPKNTALRDALRSGQTTPSELHAQLLRVVYRLMFLFVAEDRTLEGQSLLHPPDASEAANTRRQRYSDHYSTQRLRDMAGNIKGSRHGDLWQQFQLLVNALSGDAAWQTIRDELALPALGGFLWSPTSTTALNDAELTNFDLLEALRKLAFTRQNKVLRPVDYKNLGAEELGGVYESLLALTPQISGNGTRFGFAELAGNERKTSGSYYTPDFLVQRLLDSALEPVIDEAVEGKKAKQAEEAILDLKVCDPAVGSGHFLVGAAHRLARRLARTRAHAEGESEASPLLYQEALRDVIGRCLYGVDINPMAAELCRVGLWLEALMPGKPLSFLDHHIQVGNSLLGTTPALIANGLPDKAFDPIVGDDKRLCAALKKRNRYERDHRQPEMGLPMVAEIRAEYDTLAACGWGIDEAPDDSLTEIEAKAERFRQMIVSSEFRHQQRVANAWCAAMVWPKTGNVPEAVTTDGIRRLEADNDALDMAQEEQLETLAGQYQFFHWRLAFPEVFANDGFDCMLGNPPWEQVKLKEKEWFATHSTEIANAPNGAERKRRIRSLQREDPELHQQFLAASRTASGESHFLRNSGRYPLCGRGDINLYAVFAELVRTSLNARGRAGVVLPTGIATDKTTSFFFQDVVRSKSLVSLFDFENRKGIFPEVHRRMKFCLFTAGRGTRPVVDAAEYVFFAHQVDDLKDPQRCFRLSPADLALLNPNTRTCPTFRSRKDAELTRAIYRRIPVLIRQAQGNEPERNPWGIRFNRMFDMSNDSHLFRTRAQLEEDGWELEGNLFHKDEFDENEKKHCKKTCLPLYEAKMVHHFDHRWMSYGGTTPTGTAKPTAPDDGMRANPHWAPLPRYWVPAEEVEDRLGAMSGHGWLTGFRDISRAVDVRTVIAALIPATAFGNNLPLILTGHKASKHFALLSAILSSFCCDFLARQKTGGTHLNFFITKQLVVVAPASLASDCPWAAGGTTTAHFLLPRLLELSYTAWDLQPFARDAGWDGPPFRWDDERRFLARAELDAACFHLYLAADAAGDWRPAAMSDGCPHDETPEQLAALRRHFPRPRDAVDYIMDTFPIVRREDEEEHGEYRTKRVILDIYDAMQQAISTGQPWQTRLDPPPGPPLNADGNFASYEDVANAPPPHLHPPKPIFADDTVKD